MDAAFPKLHVRPGVVFTDLPLFCDSPAVEPEAPRIAPALHHAVDTCQAQERRLQLRAGSIAQTVVTYLKAHGPRTRVELADELGIRIQSICPVVLALRKQGYLVEQDAERNGGHLLGVMP